MACPNKVQAKWAAGGRANTKINIGQNGKMKYSDFVKAGAVNKCLRRFDDSVLCAGDFCFLRKTVMLDTNRTE